MRWICLLMLGLISIGCASRDVDRGIDARAAPAGWSPELAVPHPVIEVEALCAPPIGWRPQHLESNERHEHLVWLSPTGSTAYGVIRFTLPLPVGDGLALRGFLAEMKRTEGEAELIARQRRNDGTYFVAEGGKYRIRGTIVTRGFRGWVAYAGTLRGRPVAFDELELAVQARENTAPGLPAAMPDSH